MKIQLLTAAVIMAIASTSAFAGGGRSHGGGGLTNNSSNNLAVGGDTLLVGVESRRHGADEGFLAFNSGGRAIAGSIYLEGDACACDLGKVSNRSRNNIAIGEATAGSIHVNAAMRGHGPK